MNNTGRPGTKSLLDYGLIDGEHINTVTSFVIDEDSRFDAGSDHALLECTLLFGDRPKVYLLLNIIHKILNTFVILSN